MEFNNTPLWLSERETDEQRAERLERELTLVKRAVEMLITVGHLDRDKYDRAVEFLKGLD